MNLNSYKEVAVLGALLLGVAGLSLVGCLSATGRGPATVPATTLEPISLAEPDKPSTGAQTTCSPDDPAAGAGPALTGEDGTETFGGSVVPNFERVGREVLTEEDLSQDGAPASYSEALADLSALPVPQDLPSPHTTQELVETCRKALRDAKVPGVSTASMTNKTTEAAGEAADSSESDLATVSWYWDVTDGQGGRHELVASVVPISDSQSKLVAFVREASREAA